MNLADFVVLGAIVVWAVFAGIHLYRGKGKGCCGSCSDCAMCAGCTKRQKKTDTPRK